tara:strand:- start:140 stop:283 length:144 start_codon:yes stop_codon:yes gene_type:complete
MIDNLTSNNIPDDQFNHNAEESDYKKLIAKLKEIKSTIFLLEKTTFK